MDCSTPGLPVPHHLLKFAQVHLISDAIQPSHPLMPYSPSASIFPSIREFSNELLELCEPRFSHLENGTVFCPCLPGTLVGNETVTLASAVIIAQHLLFLTTLSSSLVKKREELRNLPKIIKEAGDHSIH